MSVDVDTLQQMDIGELRKYAKQYFDLTVGSRTPAETIIQQIVERTKSGNTKFATRGDVSGPKPGWSRIVVAKQTDDKIHGTKPVFCSVNTYVVYIPRGVQVDVPTKVAAYLQGLERDTIEEDETKGFDDPSRRRKVTSPRFNIQILQTNVGEDPRGTWETQRERKLAPFVKFAETYGFWPRAKDLREKIHAGEVRL